MFFAEALSSDNLILHSLQIAWIELFLTKKVKFAWMWPTSLL